MGPLPPDPYKALGVKEDADLKEIKTVYRKLVLTCHPDKFPNLSKEDKAVKEDEFQRVQQAWEILSDDNKRKEYDDEKKIKKLRDEAYKSSPHPSATRPAPKNYYEYNVNVRTTEPPPAFKPGPPPGASPYSPYQHSSPQFSSSWDRDIPTRSKPVYEEDRKARRTASYEKPSRREEDRRRAAEEERERERERDKRRAERDAREAAREVQKEKEKRERREKALELEAREMREREKRAEAKRIKKEAERAREKERDKQRRVDTQEKYRSTRKPYLEHHSESDEEVRAFMKKSSSSSSKKHSDTPTREKSSRKASRQIEVQPLEEKIEATMGYAADYMMAARRKGSKSAPAPYAEVSSFSPQFPNPDNIAFKRAATDPPRSRRASQDEKKFTATVEEESESDDDPRGATSRSFRAPPLTKAQTMAVPKPSSSSSPRGPPTLSRAQTMPTERLSPPEVPAPPVPESSSRHYSKHVSSSSSSRPRRDSYDYDVVRPEGPRRGGSSSHGKVYTIDQDEYGRRRAGSARYVPVEEMAYYTPSRSSAAHHHIPGAGFDKVKMTPAYDHVYQGKYYTQDDVIQSKYSSAYAY
ncbi:uncharacterized protein E0L32_009776 [Thyridium curvatum]|uniref:J domain-containing protein n=1 Tax=Thyridium curvatum TaxID=1093900 RepID=A0A507AQE8_9PEZI|nr:uncharacterized protein E0L32_009776 [Thyridium curvatum]TPX08714.1 hypothetical protein E0L32_009776 [Thyridium curvatum]